MGKLFTGQIEILKIHARTGTVRERRQMSNVVTTAMKSQMARMLAGDIGPSGSRRNIAQMQFGTGSQTESAADTMLQLPITPVKSVSATYPVSYTVEFEGILNTDEGNGFPISEVGLLCGDGTLAARKVFTAIDKTVDYIFTFRWRIQA